jgi:hypothetical protein
MPGQFAQGKMSAKAPSPLRNGESKKRETMHHASVNLIDRS